MTDHDGHAAPVGRINQVVHLPLPLRDGLLQHHVIPAAYQHLAAVATPGGPCGELGGSFDHGMPRHMATAPLPMAEGCVLLPDTPGMGISLDEEVLGEFRTGSEEWGG